MALPKEPRQKMINIMYLVLTALLALNVSSEILNAFKTVDHSLQNANTTIDQKNGQIFSSFQQKLKDSASAAKARIWFAKASEARDLSDNMILYLASLQKDIKVAAGYNPPKDTGYKEDNLEAATRVMSDPGTKGNELLQKLKEYKTKMLGIDTSIGLEFSKDLPIDLSIPQSHNEASKKNWSTAYFNMVPTVAALTILSKFQNDVKNSEAMVIDFCHQQVGKVEVVYDQFQAFAGTNATYLMPGQEFDITAGVGSFSSKAQPTITIDGSNVPIGPDGTALYKDIVSSPGTYTKKVVITFRKPDGQFISIPKDVTYTVGNPTGATVSADAVKVLYIGLKNPLTIQGGGVGAERVKASIDNGGLSAGDKPGQYIAEPAKAGVANIGVFVDGKPVTTSQFRVKDVPDPIAMVGASKGGHMKSNDFKAQVGVRAELENFVFEGVQFTVTGFTVVFNGAGFPELKFRQVKGNTFNEVQDLIKQCKPGTTITLDEIKATGPGGTRDLVPIVFNLTP